MSKRVIIVHGWESHPDDGWFPWLKRELEAKDFAVVVPRMPEPSMPMIEPWVSRLAEVVGDVDEDTFFVGHSIGCQTILRYLERLPAEKKVGGAVFVAGWFTLMGLDTDEERDLAKPWLETPIDFEKVKQHLSKVVAIFSDNDSVVPLENAAMFADRLGATVSVERGKGHFSGNQGIVELPSALEAVLALSA